MDSEDLTPYRTLYDGDRFQVYGAVGDLHALVQQFLQQHSERQDSADVGSRSLLDVLLKYFAAFCKVEFHEDTKESIDTALDTLKDDEGGDDAQQLV